MIGPARESEVWSRHIDDSLQLLSLIPEKARTLVDLGSGAGLPGMIIAIARPDLSVTLVEQDQRKAAFLSEVKYQLGLSNVTVAAIDVARLSGQYDVVTARALAPLTVLLAMAQPHMSWRSVGLFPKGESYPKELEEARQKWAFDSSLKASVTNESSAIITVSQLNKIA